MKCYASGVKLCSTVGNKFRNRGMDMHGARHHRVRSFGIHHVENAMNHFIAAGAKDGGS